VVRARARRNRPAVPGRRDTTDRGAFLHRLLLRALPRPRCRLRTDPRSRRDRMGSRGSRLGRARARAARPRWIPLDLHAGGLIASPRRGREAPIEPHPTARRASGAAAHALRRNRTPPENRRSPRSRYGACARRSSDDRPVRAAPIPPCRMRRNRLPLRRGASDSRRSRWPSVWLSLTPDLRLMSCLADARTRLDHAAPRRSLLPASRASRAFARPLRLSDSAAAPERLPAGVATVRKHREGRAP
jgi:hypothetical protein